MKKSELNKADKIKKYPLGTCFKTYRFFGGRVRVNKIFRYVKYEAKN